MRKVNLRDVKRWEAKAIGLYKKVKSNKISQEEARELMREVYDEIGIHYGNWDYYDANEDEYKQYWTKPALERAFEDFDIDLKYWNMRKLLLEAYGLDSRSDYFNVQF